MARTAITITEVDRSGITEPAQQNGDASNGMYLPWNDGRVLLELSSSSGTTIWTFTANAGIDGTTAPTRTVSCGAAVVKLFGPIPPGIYNQADGTVYVNPDNTTNGRIRAYHF